MSWKNGYFISNTGLLMDPIGAREIMLKEEPSQIPSFPVDGAKVIRDVKEVLHTSEVVAAGMRKSENQTECGSHNMSQ